MKNIKKMLLLSMMIFSCVCGMEGLSSDFSGQNPSDLVVVDIINSVGQLGRLISSATKNIWDLTNADSSQDDYTGMISAGTFNLLYHPDDIDRVDVLGREGIVHIYSGSRILMLDVQRYVGWYLWIKKTHNINLVEKNTGKVVKIIGLKKK